MFQNNFCNQREWADFNNRLKIEIDLDYDIQLSLFLRNPIQLRNVLLRFDG